jgi:putative endonuclease
MTTANFGEADYPPLLTVNMYYVYILVNEAKTRTYTGVTQDVEKRLKLHNSGGVRSSSLYRPYKIAYTESFETLAKARQKEKFYKSTTGRRRLKEMFFKN